MRPITHITIAGIRLGIILLAVYWVIIALGTHLPADLDVSPAMHDKWKHLLAFGGLTFGLCYVTGAPVEQATTRRTTLRFALIATVVVLYAVVDEFTQRFIPGRTPDRYDVLADAIACAAVLAIYAAVRWWVIHGSAHGARRKCSHQTEKHPADAPGRLTVFEKTGPGGGDRLCLTVVTAIRH